MDAWNTSLQLFQRGQLFYQRAGDRKKRNVVIVGYNLCHLSRVENAKLIGGDAPWIIISE